MEQKARRRRVPAFGEWNYNYYGSAELATPAAAVPFERSYAAAPELEARSDVWFKYSPPPRKPPPVSRKARKPPEKSYGGKRPRAATPARASDGVVPSSSVPRTPAKMSTGTAARAARVVQRVDADLYQVPPPEFVHDDDMRPRWKQQRRKKASRSLWMGCFGFSCRPAE
ncbi:uncharacterized protein DKFZp434B061 isoform X1 [Sorghum bicolor]|nr:uncharacterized protein DKFZp434B061 isoform X1 [Sorghum bicolor]|eukprot:XP_002458900.2 uncharacterized protein DKFZp434B061 isoform X1 [Sorghum bicolor]